ncbi:MAG: hypothetical protein NWE93_11780 [Candidatus Bathyarchaeota archaeon]|nr:hypothetical protein [Candidatus Bathyarchaeota archaeon]
MINVADNSKLLLDKLSYANLIKKWRLTTSKKLVIIRPNVPGDNYTAMFSYNAAGLVKAKAVSEGWTVTDLQANSASRANIEATINSVKPDFIIHYDHGSSYTLYGQNNNSITAAIDSANVDLLAQRAVSTVSCESAIGLGPLAVSSAETKAYLGYDELHWVHLWYLDKFMEASNAANYALLEGKTYQQAYDLAIQKYTEKYNELAAVDATAAGLMLHDRDHLQLLGNASAKASGIIISTITTAAAIPKIQPAVNIPIRKIG